MPGYKPAFNQGTILANQHNIDIVAQDPGDIVAIFTPSKGNGKAANIETLKIPLKAFTCDKTVDVTPVYGTGSHLAYQKTYGKVGYKGSFTINSWIDQAEKMKLEHLVYSQEKWEGTPMEFDIIITDRVGAGGEEGRTGETSETAESGGASQASPVIVKVLYCTLSSSGIDIGEPGNVIATKYEYVALRRQPY